MLIVLKDYEDSEWYEECAIIRDSILEYRDTYEDKLPENIKFPLSLKEYRGKTHQEMLFKHGLSVEDKLAEEKAKLIKINLPVKHGN